MKEPFHFIGRPGTNKKSLKPLKTLKKHLSSAAPNVHSGSKFVFGFLESTLCKKNTSPNSTQTMIKRRNSWRMLGKNINATRPKKN